MENGYSNESARRELSNEYQHDRAGIGFKSFSILVLRTKVALALEGLKMTRKQPLKRSTSLYAPISLSVQTGEFMPQNILIIALPRDWQGFKNFTTSS